MEMDFKGSNWAMLRGNIRIILRTHGCPLNKQKKTVQTEIEQPKLRIFKNILK